MPEFCAHGVVMSEDELGRPRPSRNCMRCLHAALYAEQRAIANIAAAARPPLGATVRHLEYLPQFAGAVERGDKRQTIRSGGDDAPQPGDELRHWCGGTLLGRSRCESVQRIRIGEGYPDGVRIDLWSLGDWRPLLDVWVFARRDGFKNADAMRAFFADRYGLPFEGVVVGWRSITHD